MSTVLIVDDSSWQRNVLSALVKEEGYEAQTATNGKEGLDLLLAESPDCVLLDMLMPEMDGIQVLEALKTRGITIPVAVISADIQEWKKERCLELGAQFFLKKPFKKDELRATLKSLLDPSMREVAHAGPHA